MGGLAAWHRARRGVTMVMNGTEWTGAAAVDRTLMAAGYSPDEWTLADLHSLGPTRAISFRDGAGVETVFLDRNGTIIVDRDYLSDPGG